MTRMKYTLPALVLLLALVSCRERQIVVRDTIPYVKQIAVDTVDTFELVRTYRTAGTKGSIAVIGEAIPWKEIGLLHLAFFLLQLEIAAVCYGISACIWRGGLGIGLGIAVGMYFLNIIANLSKSVEFLKGITPFGYADGPTIINSGCLDTARLLIGLAFTVCGVALAYIRYCRKDIR